ncbi:MAG: hypothetical protein H6709_05350 [Kofleriaceae bacterium]|nr:hypothetical protein [Myxococcales bacterium]MCB9559887.1 hypothetical protein [Kofleriaceae bacterium]MCB9571499.1 hypothetical protein [Kofleriaceae bacterium]
MRRPAVTGALIVAATAAAALSATPAFAGDNDLVLTRLGKISNDLNGDPVAVAGQNLEFRSLVSELGVVLAPRLLTPSDTLGFGGFQFSADVGYTSISSDASWWRALASSPDPTAMGGVEHGSNTMPTLGLFVRKGMWFPIPSVEVGAGFVHLMDSTMWAAQTYAKVGIHEGYHDLPVPSVSVRGGASRLMGSNQLDLTVASLDVEISKQLGIAGTWALTPYGGWNVLFIVPRSEVLDATPGVDSLVAGNEQDSQLNFVFKDQDNIIRNRFFFGAKMQYYVFELTLEAAFALKGSSVDDRGGTDVACMLDSTTTSCDSTDQAGAQSTLTASLGLDF